MSRRVLLMLIAGLIAAFTAVSVRNRLAQAPVEQVAQTAARVVVAKHDLAPGTFVQGAQDLDWGPAPAPAQKPNAGENPDYVPEQFLFEGAVKLTDFNGAVVRRQLHAGDPVSQSALTKAGEGGFMSAVLEAGMRAVSIAVNATSGNAGFISPGDRIDLIVTHRLKKRSTEGVSNEESVISETFVRNVRVVAVDQMLDNPENKAILAKTVTVEVSPRQAEQVAVAAEMGKISIALRSAAPEEAKKPTEATGTGENANVLTDLYGNAVTPVPNDTGFTRDSDVSPVLEHKMLSVPRVQVIRGDKSENLEFYQDAQ